MSCDVRGRRAALATLAGLGAGACSLSPSLELLGSSFDGLTSATGFGREKPYPVTAREIDELPYATMGLRFGGGDPAVLVLAEYDGEDLHWSSADRVIFVTRRGWLVKTVGLPRDIVATQWHGENPLPGLARGEVFEPGSRMLRTLDLRPRDEFGVAVESQFEVLGRETLEVLGRRRETICLREKASVRRWRWTADNRFWVDPASGRVWRSSQQFCPELPPLVFDVLKPAAEAGLQA